jgi:hypothetical protein
VNAYDLLMSKIYEHRAVLFLDILGFKDLVDREKTQTILDVLNIPTELQIHETGVRRFPFDGTSGMEISAFSDSIVISQLVGNDGFGVTQLVHYANHLWVKFLARGVLTRGGIAIGELHHRNSILFGPAMNHAYKLESQVANYPRIVVEKSVRDQVLAQYKSNSRMDVYQRQIFREDFDGIHHINTIGHHGNFPIEELRINKTPGPNGGTSWTQEEVLEGMRQFLINVFSQANSSLDLRVKAKHEWLRKYAIACGIPI